MTDFPKIVFRIKDYIKDYNLGNESFINFVHQLKESKNPTEIQSFYVKAAKIFSNSNNQTDRLIAMDIYQQLLTVNPDNLYSNYPFLLDSYDYKEEAGCLWFRCYQKSPTEFSDLTIKGYVDYLKAANRSDLAEKAENREV